MNNNPETKLARRKINKVRIPVVLNYSITWKGEKWNVFAVFESWVKHNGPVSNISTMSSCPTEKGKLREEKNGVYEKKAQTPILF